MSISSSDLSNQTFSSLQLKKDQRSLPDDSQMINKSGNGSATNGFGEKTEKEDQSDKKEQLAKVKVSKEDIAEMNKSMSQLNLRLSFEVTEEGGHNVVKVLDQSTGHIVRQIPTEEYLKMSEQIHNVASQVSDLKGVLFNGKA